MCVQANFADIYLRGMRDRSMRSGTELAREIQLTDWSTAGEQGKLIFVVSTTPSLAQFISLFTTGKKSSFDRLNYRSIQVFHFKISVKKKRRKEIPIDKQFFFVAWIKFVACALRENLPNRSSRVQIPRDICTRLGRYLYSTKWSWIIMNNIFALHHISLCSRDSIFSSWKVNAFVLLSSIY